MRLSCNNTSFVDFDSFFDFVVIADIADVTNAPSKSPVADEVIEIPANTAPTEGPTEVDDTSDAGVYAVVFNTIYLNLFLTASKGNAQQVVENASYQEELERIVSDHILKHVRSDVDTPRLVVECLTNVKTVSTLAPWGNATIVSSDSVEGTVQFHKNYGKPRAEAINNIVQEAFTGAALDRFLSELRRSSDVVLMLTDSIHVGLPSNILPSTTTANSGALEEEEWMSWGDFSDPDFVILVSVAGATVLAAFFYFVWHCCFKGRVRKPANPKSSLSPNSKATETSPLSPTSSSDSDKTTTEQLELGCQVENSMVAVIDEDGKTTECENDNDLEYLRGDISEVTSVYSYFESKSIVEMEDQTYSVVDTYNPHISGDEASGEWSLSVAENTLVQSAAAARSRPSWTPAVASSGKDLKTAPTEPEAAPVKTESVTGTPTSKTARSIGNSPAGPHIFSDNSEDTGDMESSIVREDVAETAEALPPRPTKSLVASVVATFEKAAQSKTSGPSSPAKSESSFPDRIESSIMMLAPDSPKAAPESSDGVNENQATPPSPTGSFSKKPVECPMVTKLAPGSNKSPTSNLTSSGHSDDKQGSNSSVPTTISVQNSDNSDGSKRSNQATSSFILRSMSVDQADNLVPPASIIRVSGVKDEKPPAGSYIMRAKSWGNRPYSTPSSAATRFNKNDNGGPASAKLQAENGSAASKKGFPFKGLGASKATQKALSSAGGIPNELPAIHSNPSTLSENQSNSIHESDSDIQSLCSFDNTSMFSFGGQKTGASLLGLHGTSPYMHGLGLSDDDDEDSASEIVPAD